MRNAMVWVLGLGMVLVAACDSGGQDGADMTDADVVEESGESEFDDCTFETDEDGAVWQVCDGGNSWTKMGNVEVPQMTPDGVLTQDEFDDYMLACLLQAQEKCGKATLDISQTPPECKIDPNPCDDNNACTIDSCNTKKGICTHAVATQDSKCCEEAADCHDGDLCTEQKCVLGSNTCEYIPIVCDDENPCTKDSCTGAQCNFEPIIGCCTTVQNCDDDNLCTIDACNEGSCSNEPVVCDDGNLCTLEVCSVDAGGGCVSDGSLNCDDGNAATADSCDPVFGCKNVWLECVSSSDCVSSNPCVQGTCVAGACTFSEPTDCSDGSACTISTCNGAGGCAVIQVSCDDGNPATMDFCNPVLGCQYELGDCLMPEECNDGDACMLPYCFNFKCGYTPKNCDDGIDCTVDSCDTNGYCVHLEDDSLCPGDSKCSGKGLFTGCVECASWGDCDDGDPCTNDFCNADLGTCTFEPLCDESWESCIVEDDWGYCEPKPGFCESKWECKSEDPCLEATDCLNHVCVFEPKDCSDGNPCTEEVCVPGQGCQSEWNVCSDGNPCTFDDCNLLTGECEHFTNESQVCVPCKVDSDCVDDTLYCWNPNKAYQFLGTCIWDEFGDGGKCDLVVDICTSSACYEQDCHEGIGCESELIEECQSNDPCIEDWCDVDVDEGAPVCNSEPKWQCGCEIDFNCHDDNPCTLDACEGIPDVYCHNVPVTKSPDLVGEPLLCAQECQIGLPCGEPISIESPESGESIEIAGVCVPGGQVDQHATCLYQNLTFVGLGWAATSVDSYYPGGVVVTTANLDGGPDISDVQTVQGGETHTVGPIFDEIVVGIAALDGTQLDPASVPIYCKNASGQLSHGPVELRLPETLELDPVAGIPFMRCTKY